MTAGVWRSGLHLPGYLLRAYDPYVHAFTVIDEEHRLVHDGAGFQADYYHASLANATALNVHFKTGANPCHLRALDVALNDGPDRILFYKNATCTADGTLFTQTNCNLLSSATPLAGVYASPTISVPGTLIADTFVPDPGGVGVNVRGTISSSFGEEIIMAPNTSYILEITNNSGAAIPLGLKVFWYEVPSGYTI